MHTVGTLGRCEAVDDGRLMALLCLVGVMGTMSTSSSTNAEEGARGSRRLLRRRLADVAYSYRLHRASAYGPYLGNGGRAASCWKACLDAALLGSCGVGGG